MTPEQRARLELQAKFSQTDDLRALLAERDALAEALKKYGRHVRCDAEYVSVCGDSQRCTCGLTDILTKG